jgi:predicted nucleic acid-binding protein
MKQTVYIETTIPSYLAARPSRDLIRAAEQQLTRDWWATRDQYELRVSRIVIAECTNGDPNAAEARLKAIEGIPILVDDEETEALAQILLRGLQFPDRAAADAFHIAVASLNGVDKLVTWNCKHIANPDLRVKLEVLCRRFGVEPPTICTPRDILGVQS